MAIPSAISLMKDHILAWVLILAVGAIPGAVLGTVSWWWVGALVSVLAVEAVREFAAGWRRGPLYPPRTRRRSLTASSVQASRSATSISHTSGSGVE